MDEEAQELPPSLLDLPVELLLRIASLLGADLKVYTDKERQADLARIAPVNSTFCHVARTLLYGGVVNVRSAGRTFLLHQTLHSAPSLASLVRTLVAKSESDNGHLASLISILSLTRLTSATLSAVFFTSNPPFELYTALQSHTQLRAFSYGYRGIDTPLAPIAPLLQLAPPYPSHPRPCRPMGAESLVISNCRIIDTPGWPLLAIKWLLGSTNCLASLTLVGFDGLFDLPQLFTLLTARHCAYTLEHLVIRNFRNAIEFDPDFPPPPFDPKTFPTFFPSLSSMSLGNNDDETCFASPTPSLVLPPSLRTLELYEDLFLDWRLLATIEEGRSPLALRNVKLVGPFPTDPDVKALKQACEERGMLFEVERTF
ncbi:hypothetical protein JCM11641_005844 [Rhodosporidiobolus odoratus]